MRNREWCFYGRREGAAHQWLGSTNAIDAWSVKKINPQSMVRLTDKPVELAARAMRYSSRPGENVLDLFGESGSMLIAAESTPFVGLSTRLNARQRAAAKRGMARRYRTT